MTATTEARAGLPFRITAGSGGEARGYVVDVESVSWRTVPVTRQGVDQGAGPGEQALSNEAVWRRTRNSWHLGAGQQWADEIDESDSRRFYTSDGLDPWDIRCLKPLPTVSQRRSSANASIQMVTARVSGVDYLVVMDGNSVVYSSNPESASPTWTSATGLAGTLSSLTTDGSRVWIASGADIYLLTPGTPAVSNFSTYNATVVGYANGRLLAASGATLVEVLAGGTTTTLFTHPNANFVWEGIVGSPGGIYTWGSNGVRSEVFVTTAIDMTGQLDVPFVAVEMPDGEYLRAMCFYGGVMLLATSRGLRLALITGGGFLSFGPLVDEPGDVRCLEPQGEDVWFGWTYASQKNGLGRARLSRFTSDLVPAFATDLMARGASVSGNVVAAATVANKRYFAIASRGVYGEDTTLEPTGVIDLGRFDYAISEPKIFDSLSLWSDALPASCSVVARVYADDETVTPLATITHDVDGATKITGSYDGATEAESLRIELTITNGGTSFCLHRMTLRAAPKPFVSEMITLPLILTAAARSENRAEIGQDPWEEWDLLHDLMLERTRCEVVVGSHTFYARIDGIEAEKGGLGGGNGLNGWDDRLQFFEGKWEVTFTTVEPDTPTP